MFAPSRFGLSDLLDWFSKKKNVKCGMFWKKKKKLKKEFAFY